MALMISGIYVITNRKSGKVYIGSTTNFERRWIQHRSDLRCSTHGNSHLQCAWNKYGEDVFEFGVLEYMDNFEKLTKAEQFWMDVYREENRSLYNFGMAADCPWRGQTHTEEAKRRIGKAGAGRVVSEKTRQKLSDARKGVEFSEEHRYRISVALAGNQNGLGYRHSEEAKQKMSESNRRREVTKETRQRMSKSQGKLTENQVLWIRALAKEGILQKDIGTLLDVSASTISVIVSHRIWTWVSD